MISRVITHCNRCAILFIVDCSLSMKSITRFSNTEMPKIEAASIIVNHIIDELMARATRANYVRDYYDIGIIGYSGCEATSLLSDDSKIFMRLPRLAENKPQPKTIYLNKSYHAGTPVKISFQLHPWIEPSASGASPMYDAMVMAKEALRGWCNDPGNNRGYAPIVFHITDGVASDADDVEMQAITKQIKSISLNGDNVLFFNIYLASLGEGDETIDIFPKEYTFATRDKDREFIYNISSQFPREFEGYIDQLVDNSDSEGPYRAVAFNTTPVSILSLLNIGTQRILPLYDHYDRTIEI
ncbi:MAG: hypothetical protein J6V19_00165 [Alistipes sp.]|nr:hypothetical protein [Alistipes sp.]